VREVVIMDKHELSLGRKGPGCPSRHRGITAVASLMILCGLAEVVTGFTHNFFGLTTSHSTNSSYAGAMIGSCYFIGGLLLLSGRKWAAALAIVLLIADVLGRVVMVLTGLYPVDSALQIAGMVVGTSLAAFFAVYSGLNWNTFR
jgi:hypothetical protein